MSSAVSSLIRPRLSWRLTAALYCDSKPKHTHDNAELCKRRFELFHFRSDFKEDCLSISSHEAHLIFYIHIFDGTFGQSNNFHRRIYISREAQWKMFERFSVQTVTEKAWIIWLRLKQLTYRPRKVFRGKCFFFMLFLWISWENGGIEGSDWTFLTSVHSTKFSTQLAINDHLKRTLHKGKWAFISVSKRHIVRFVSWVSFEHFGSFAAISISIKWE